MGAVPVPSSPVSHDPAGGQVQKGVSNPDESILLPKLDVSKCSLQLTNLSSAISSILQWKVTDVLSELHPVCQCKTSFEIICVTSKLVQRDWNAWY